MAGIYQADKWCDECAQAIAKELIREERFPSYWGLEDKRTVVENDGDASVAGIDADSDDWPNWGYSDDEEADSPHHCGANSECLNKIDLCEYGLLESDALHGAEERYVGAIVSSLTMHGAEQTAEMLRERPRTPYQKALHELWREVFSNELCNQDLGPDDEDEQDEQNHELSMQFAINAVECVMMLLGNRRRMIVDKFFGHASVGYQDEWMNRDPFAFWCHLDVPLKRELVEMALEFYTNQD